MFPSREDLLKWVHRVGYGLGFVIVIIRCDLANGKRRRKTYVLLGYERGVVTKSTRIVWRLVNWY